MAWPERAKVNMDVLSRQRPVTFEQMKAQAERVHAQSLQSVKERIENAKMKPNTLNDELAKLQAEIVNLYPDVVTKGIPVIRLSNDNVRLGTWYEIAQPNQQESTIYLKHPFYYKWETRWGIGMLIIKLGEDVLGGDETLLLRFENRGKGSYADIQLAVSKKLSDLGYDGVIFYENEPLQLIEVYSIPITNI